MRRLFLLCLLIITVLWIHPIIGFALSVIFGFFNTHDYYEIIIIGAFIDVAYQTILIIHSVTLPMYTLIGLVIFFAVRALKQRMNIYA